MPKLEIVPFSDQHVPDAGRLLAERQRRHREAEPLLPPAFEDAERAAAEIAAAEDVSGAVALSDGHVVGYLIGAPRDAEWGENIWIEFEGHAAEDPEVVRDLYALAAARWFEEGRRRHYALVPAHDPALGEAWFRLGFGHQQAHAVQEVGPRDVRVPGGFEIRPPRPEDVEGLLALDLALPTHQRQSPVFSDRPLPSEQESRDEWADTLARTDEDVLIGFQNGRGVACWSVVDAQLSSHHQGLSRPERSSYLGFAVTLPEARGSGIGTALTDAAIARAAERGYESMATDWRVTNLLASRFWPRRGFRTTFLRLYRSIP